MASARSGKAPEGAPLLSVQHPLKTPADAAEAVHLLPATAFKWQVALCGRCSSSLSAPTTILWLRAAALVEVPVPAVEASARVLGRGKGDV